MENREELDGFFYETYFSSDVRRGLQELQPVMNLRSAFAPLSVEMGDRLVSRDRPFRFAGGDPVFPSARGRVQRLLALAMPLLILILLSAIPSEAVPDLHAYCFAFLKQGDIFLRCDGLSEAITARGDIESFAISTERSALAYVTAMTVARGADAESKVFSTSIVDLTTGRQRLAQGGRELIRTCGGVAYVRGAQTGDIVTGDGFGATGYSWFRCSSDKTTTVGVARKGGALLGERLDAATNQVAHFEIAPASAFTDQFFDISPDGSKISFVGSGRPLCVANHFALPRCAEVKETVIDRPAVDNNGSVLFAFSTADECIYTTPWNFSRVSPSRAGGGRKDACAAIGYWAPGMRALQIVAPIGRAPQWIDPEMASLLRALVSRVKL